MENIQDFRYIIAEAEYYKEGLLIENIWEFNAGNNKEYEVEVVQNSKVYGSELEGHLPPRFYYFLLWKLFPEEENI